MSCDTPGEAIYIRDEARAKCGVPRHCRFVMRPRPTWRGTDRATAGSSMRSHGISLDLLQFVPPDDPIKIFAAHSCKTIPVAPGGFQ